MKTTTLIALSTILFSSTAAFAADAIVYNEPAPTAAVAADVTPSRDYDTFSWTGGYIGLNAGWGGGQFRNKFSVYDTVTGESIDRSRKSHADGFVGGIQAGYNWQHEDVVLGVETDFQGSTTKKNKDYAYGISDLDLPVNISNKINWFGTTRVRAGYLPDAIDRTLFYVTGGVAYGQVKTSYTYFDDFDNTSDTVSKSKTKAGFALGGGAEYALTDNISLKGEYLFIDLGKQKVFNNVAPDLELGASGEASRNQLHTVRLGVNYKF